MEQAELSRAIYRALAKAILLGLFVFAIASVVDAITIVLLLFFLSSVFAIALIPVVNWFEAHGLNRVVGTLITFFVMVGVFVGVAYLVFPILAEQLRNLSEQAPQYLSQLADRGKNILSHYPQLEAQLRDPQTIKALTPSPATWLGTVGAYSLNAVYALLGVIVLITSTLYIMAKPRPLFRAAVMAVPLKLRDNFAKGFATASDTVVRWVWANAIIGAVEGVAAATFLWIIGIPGALVWGVVTFFAELVPQLGSYIMAIPPLLVALAVDPTKALYVLIFYIALQQLVNSFLAPILRASTMHIHPLSEIFAVLALTAAFGIIGAIISSPFIAFAKAFYDSFYTARQPDDGRIDERVDFMMGKRESLET